MKRYIKASTDKFCVIKTSDWYDPEGLNIPDDGKVVFSGTLDECSDWLTDKYWNAKTQKETAKHRWDIDEIVEDYKPHNSLVIYYPHAIAKAYFTIQEVTE